MFYVPDFVPHTAGMRHVLHQYIGAGLHRWTRMGHNQLHKRLDSEALEDNCQEPTGSSRRQTPPSLCCLRELIRSRNTGVPIYRRARTGRSQGRWLSSSATKESSSMPRTSSCRSEGILSVFRTIRHWTQPIILLLQELFGKSSIHV